MRVLVRPCEDRWQHRNERSHPSRKAAETPISGPCKREPKSQSMSCHVSHVKSKEFFDIVIADYSSESPQPLGQATWRGQHPCSCTHCVGLRKHVWRLDVRCRYALGVGFAHAPSMPSVVACNQHRLFISVIRFFLLL